MPDSTPTLTAEQRARDLTYAIMRHYGYTDEDIIAAEATHPGLACGDECGGEDGLSKHPIYDELASTASLMVDVVEPLIARMVADAEQRGRAEVSAAVEARVDQWPTHAAGVPLGRVTEYRQAVTQCATAIRAALADPAAAVARIKAEAWDEGYTAADFAVHRGVANPCAVLDRGNPYRADRIGGET